MFTKEESLDNFENRIKKDAIKREYAKNNGYKFIEISYKDHKRISEILDIELKNTVIIQKEQCENKQLVFELCNENNGVNYVG